MKFNTLLLVVVAISTILSFDLSAGCNSCSRTCGKKRKCCTLRIIK